jgi:hypothetical protein
MNNMPLYIAIGAASYEVILEGEDWYQAEGCVGMVDKEQFTIHLYFDGRPAADCLNTLIHELLHVCYQEYNIKPKCAEERTVTSLGYAMSSLLVQNPMLLPIFGQLVEEARHVKRSREDR